MFASLKEKAKQITQDLSILFIAYKRRDVPILAKIIIIMAIAYALSPIDLIPDFIPILGALDDIIILPLLIYISVKIIPKNILEECREEVKEKTISGKNKKWYYGIPIIVIWVLIVIIIIKHIMTENNS
jgi:uncharacterized membrane protein YkvA (DUF1232 family)